MANKDGIASPRLNDPGRTNNASARPADGNLGRINEFGIRRPRNLANEKSAAPGMRARRVIFWSTAGIVAQIRSRTDG